MSSRLALLLCALTTALLSGCYDRLSVEDLREEAATAASRNATPAAERPAPRENIALKENVSPDCYRFDNHIDDAQVVTGPATDDSTFAYRVDFSADVKPWTITDGDARCATEGNALTIETQSPAHCDSPPLPGVRASKVREVLIEARVSGTSQFTFAWSSICDEFAKENSAIVDVPQTGGWSIFSFDTSALSTWYDNKGEVCQLRFDLPGNAKMEVRSIALANFVDPFGGKSYGQIDYSLARRSVHAAFLRTPCSLEYDVSIMPNTELSSGFLSRDAVPTQFRILLNDGSDQTVLVDQQLDKSGVEQKTSVDMSPWAGKKVQIRFEAKSQDRSTVAMWCNPKLQRLYPVTEPSRPMNVIWYVIDCLRATNVGAYGYERNTTPEIDAVAADGARFEWCFSPGTWTIDTVPSFFTGLSPIVHGLYRTHWTIPDSLHVLPQILRDAGYSTALFSQNPYLVARRGFAKGFSETYQYHVRDPREIRRPFSVETYGINAGIAEYLEQHREEPIFLYVHTIEPHHPYVPPGELRVFGQRKGPDGLTDAYDSCIRWADMNLGFTISQLKKNGLWDNTLLVITADHGECLPEFDGRGGHGLEPFLPRVRIPLIMRLPGSIPTGAVIPENVQGVDITRTIFDLLDIEPDPQFGGMSLMGLLDGTKKDVFGKRTIFPTGEQTKWQAAVHGKWFFLDLEGNGTLYDMSADPHQKTDVSQNHRDVAQQMQKATEEFTASELKNAKEYSTLATETVEVDAEERHQLEALGYVGGE